MSKSQTPVNSVNSHPVNNGKQGDLTCNPDILKRTQDTINMMTNKHNKVLFVRFDAHYPSGYTKEPSSSHISDTFKRLSEDYQRKGIDTSYVWAREQPQEELPQHYHCALMLDGNKVQSHMPVVQKAEVVWGNTIESDSKGLVDYCNRQGNGIMIRRPSSEATGEKLLEQQQSYQEKLDQCHQWASYLAKENQKEGVPSNMRTFGSSRISKQDREKYLP